jgi:APA family basic amino acid/polyamine antiporter
MDPVKEKIPAKALNKDLGLVAALSLVVGMVLGAGAFMKPPAVLAMAGDSTGALIAWMIGGLLSMAGGLTVCELGVLFPRTGGVYIYLEELYGPRTAFLYGWMIMMLYGPASIGALAGYFSAVFCTLFGVSPQYAVVVSAGVMTFVLFVNSIGVRQAGWLQTGATFCKLIPVFLLAVFGLWKGNGQVLGMSSGMSMAAPFSAAVLATLFAYDGWAQVASVAGEMKKPGKILPQAIIGGVSFLAIVYLIINVALLKVLPADQMVSLGHAASTIAAQNLFGLVGGNLISVGIMIAILGGLNGYTMTLSRTIFVMGERGYIPGSQIWKKIDPDSQSPLNAMLLLMGLSYLYYRLLDADRLSDIAMFSIWIFYLLTFIGVFIARRTHADVPRSYKVPLYPLIPVVAIGGAIYVLYGMLTAQFFNAIAAIILTLIGLPVYYYMGRKSTAEVAIPALRKKYVIALCCLFLMAVIGLSVRMFDTRPYITVAIEPSNPPFSFERQGQLTGFDVELMEAIAGKIGAKVSYRPIALENMFEAVSKNYVEVAIASLSVTEERARIVGFTSPYLADGGLSAVVAKGRTVQSPPDLTRLNIGVARGSTGEQLVSEVVGAKMRPFESSVDMSREFSSGMLDAIVHDRLILENLVARGLLPSDAKMTPVKTEAYAIAYGKENKALGDSINKALAELQKNGELRALRDKWFGVAASH